MAKEKSSFDKSLDWWSKLNGQEKYKYICEYGLNMPGFQLISQDVHRIYREKIENLA